MPRVMLVNRSNAIVTYDVKECMHTHIYTCVHGVASCGDHLLVLVAACMAVFVAPQVTRRS